MVQNTKSGGGKTLVGGTGYDIPFAPKQCNVRITGNTHEQWASVSINGTTYAGRGVEIDETVVVGRGTQMTCFIKGSANTYPMAKITVDGITVAQCSSSQKSVTYTYTIKDNISVGYNCRYMASTDNRYGAIAITTTP